jgi:hypothetical protein
MGQAPSEERMRVITGGDGGYTFDFEVEREIARSSLEKSLGFGSKS